MTSGPLHPIVLGRPRGTLWSNIRGSPTARSPPCRPHASVSLLQVPAAAPFVRGGTPRRHVPPLRTCHHTTLHVWGPGAMLGWHCYPPGPPSRLTLYRLTTGSSPLTLHGRALSSGPIHPVVAGQPIGTLWSNIRARPTARSPPCRPDASVSPLQVPAAAPSVRGAHPGDAGRAFATATTLPDL